MGNVHSFFLKKSTLGNAQNAFTYFILRTFRDTFEWVLQQPYIYIVINCSYKERPYYRNTLSVSKLASLFSWKKIWLRFWNISKSVFKNLKVNLGIVLGFNNFNFTNKSLTSFRSLGLDGESSSC